MADVEGFCDERFTAVREALTANLSSGADVGASVAVYLGDEPVVDLWGGQTQDGPWRRDTITNVWSITKTMTALCALMLADRGELDFHAPVARYWPEFAVAGKERVEVRHLMGHTAGLPKWTGRFNGADLYDWEKATSLLAAQEPEWEPGTESGYHALTQGYLVGEVVRRITGRTLGTFFREEVAGPLGADFHIGLPTEHDHRVAHVIPPEDAPPPAPPRHMAEVSWTSDWRRAEIPAAGGHGNARSVARIQSVMATGGGSLLSAAGCERVFEQQSDGVDRVLGTWVRFGLGYGLPSRGLPLPNPRTVAWGGWGGSIVVADLDAGMTVSYVMNRMAGGLTGDARGAGLVLAAYAGLAES
ncbi:serine hydrolase domain-containing protein [Actinoallomurus iriomotensis]|uniref:Serine hydrolase n=1 Tax=Actinoallomurus iriomotensis TaxID=478107 RepID=A0A9W6RZS3_9ACTN|nr:serine hydrolase domain-containing protein [Actinoallomurus iriomotensis]GLY85826.1 serine hydrolase [Actinoallomurus iriomotensis]